MEELIELLTGIDVQLTEIVKKIIKVSLLIMIYFPIIYFLKKWVKSTFTLKYSLHYGQLMEKFVGYTGFILLLISLLHIIGVGIGPLLGAAGVVGIALGVASQTSVSNIIAGFFMIAEQSFKIGDIISVGSKMGIVLSVDTLSVKLRTFDNLYVRIPNETMIKSDVTNLTYFPIRRIDIQISVAYKEDLEKVKTTLSTIAKNHPQILQEPEPLIIFKGFGNSSIDFQFSVWALKENYLTLKNMMQELIKRSFDEQNIEIPFPHVSIYKGLASEPFQIKILKEEEDKSPSPLST